MVLVVTVAFGQALRFAVLRVRHTILQLQLYYKLSFIHTDLYRFYVVGSVGLNRSIRSAGDVSVCAITIS